MRTLVFIFGGLVLVSAPFLLAAGDTPTVRSADVAMIANCTLMPEQEAQVPAQEAGVLTNIRVREGDSVTPGQLLAQIDDIIPRAQQDVAKYKLDVAKKQAEDDIDVRFASAAAAVAKADYEQAMEANEKIRGTVPQAEVRKRLLDWHKMVLSIEKAKKDMAVAGLQAKVGEAELNAQIANVERRRLVTPPWRGDANIDAVVVELSRRLGEWVQIGEPVMRLVRIDRLRVDGVLDAKEYRPSDIQDRPVQVSVLLPHTGSRQTFSGKIVYVKPVIEGGTLQVRAEVENRKQDGVWILYPGMPAEMTIGLRETLRRSSSAAEAR
jgi:multidrug efflux pump subunit AcrA (membrane-fusion protein)